MKARDATRDDAPPVEDGVAPEADARRDYDLGSGFGHRRRSVAAVRDSSRRRRRRVHELGGGTAAQVLATVGAATTTVPIFDHTLGTTTVDLAV